MLAMSAYITHAGIRYERRAGIWYDIDAETFEIEEHGSNGLAVPVNDTVVIDDLNAVYPENS